MRFDEIETAAESDVPADVGLTEALAAAETEFVTSEQKPAMNRSTAALIFLALLGGGGLYFMHMRTGPSAALAAESEAAEQTITSFLSGGESNIQMMEKALTQTQSVVQRFLTYPNASQIPLGELKTNPFRFAPETPSLAQNDVISKRRREEERQSVISAVQSLQLQSIMSGGAQAACMINNTLFKEGQVVDAFTIEKISSSAVVVRQGQYRFELRMQR